MSATITYSRLVVLALFLPLLALGCGESVVDPLEPEIAEVRLKGTAEIFGIGGTASFEATILDDAGAIVSNSEIDWSVSDESVLEVDQNGLVRSVGHGQSSVVARTGAVSGSLSVTVHGSGDFVYPSTGVVLSSRLTLPTGSGPFPAVVAVSGSEASRKENYQIPALIAAGFAVLSYDKRGVGGSTGVCPCPGGTGLSVGNSKQAFQDLSDDVLAGVTFLKAHHDIDSTKIGLIGWSQAGWIIPLAASKSDDIAFMVNVVGPTVSVGEEIYYSSLTGDSGTGPLPNGRTMEEILTLVEEFTGNSGFDPAPILRRVDTPGLWPLGGMDRSIPTPITIARIEALVTELGKPFTVHLYPNGNHSLTDVTTGRRIPHLTMPGGTIEWMQTQLATES